MIASVMVPMFAVLWLVQKASINERAVLENALRSAQVRESKLLKVEFETAVRDWMEEVANEFKRKEWDLARSTILDNVRADVVVKKAPIRSDSYDETDDQSLKSFVNEILFVKEMFGETAAVHQIKQTLRNADLDGVRVEGGRLLKPMLLWMGVEMSIWAGEDVSELVKDLSFFLLSEERDSMPLGQRYFVLNELCEILDDREDLLKEKKRVQLMVKWERIRPGDSGLSDLDEILFRDGVVAFFADSGSSWILVESDNLMETIEPWLQESTLRNRESDSRMDLVAPGVAVEQDPFLTTVVDLFAPLEGWRLKVSYDDPNEGEAWNSKILIYVWVGSTTVLLTSVLVLIGIHAVRRQLTMAQLKNDLVATVSHELKTPVASIRLLIETLQGDEESVPPKTREYLELIQHENRRLSDLVEKFLTFSRMDRGRSRIEMREESLTEVLSEAETVFKERYSKKDYELEVEDQDPGEALWIDRSTFLIAMNNLLENAYKYGGRQKFIRLTGKVNESEAVFEVQDNGKGLSKADGRRIFKKFYQKDRGLTQHRGGVGLGLSIVSFVVRKHNGRVELESELGKGSIFRIIIPRYANVTHH